VIVDFLKELDHPDLLGSVFDMEMIGSWKSPTESRSSDTALSRSIFFGFIMAGS